MREPEFLPSWYPVLLRRRALLFAQTWLTVVVCLALAAWAVVGQQQVRLAQKELASVKAQLNQTGMDLQRLAEIETLKQELEQQAELIRRLGVNVPATRMLAALDQLMPDGMALLDFQLHTDETLQPLSDADRARGVTPEVNRKLLLNLTGVAPTEDDLATFLTRLVGLPYFREVELVKAEDHPQDSHITRRFEVKFALDLDDATKPLVATADQEAQ